MENNDIIKINTNNLKIIALVLYSIFTRLWHICHIYIYIVAIFPWHLVLVALSYIVAFCSVVAF